MNFTSRLLKTTAAVIFVGLIGLGWTQAQAISDWIKLYGYTPPPRIVSLARDVSFTNQATHIFYVNKPELTDNVATFRQECPYNEQTIVLGCYHGGQNGIDVYDVQDARLAGIQQVTAAHEMLHAAYDRLSQKEKVRINGLLENFYKNQLQDDRVKETINAYKKTEPADLTNEMHSIFGTEITNLPAELEDYYKRYFFSRAVVVGFASNYEGEFTNRLAQIKAYDERLAGLRTQIEQKEKALSDQLDKINDDRARLDNYRDSNRIADYNAAVPAFNAAVDSYNAQVKSLKADIAEYNQLLEVYNSLAGELRSLYKAIDTRLAPAEQ